MKGWLASLLERGAQLWVEDGDVCYRAPSGVVTPDIRAEIAAHKPALLEFLGRGQKWAPASFAQQRLWFLDRYDDDDSVYVLPSFAMRLRGPLDVEALDHAWRAVVQRHEPLRTVFREVDGRSAQLIKASGAKLERVKLEDGGDREGRARAFVAAKAAGRFSLADGPLVQGWLATFADDDHVFCAPMHHIITDGMSMDVLLRDLAGFYSRACPEEALEPNPPPVTYADYACAQRAALTGERLEALNNFWRGQLSGLPPLLELPTDRPRPPRQTFDGDAVAFGIAPSTTAAVQALATELGTTPLVVLLTAYAAVLQRWSGQDAFAVGMPAAGRVHPALAALAGFFVNTLPIAVQLEEGAFADAVSRTQDAVTAALAHQDLPFERLVEAIQPSRNLSHSPIFQVQFVQEPMPRGVTFGEETTATAIAAPTVKTKYDLGLFVRHEGERMHGRLEFNSGLFDDGTAKRFVAHFTHLLDAAVSDPAVPVRVLPLEAATATEVIASADEPHDGPAFETVSQAFTDAAAKYSDRTAVVCGATCWAYAELTARVERWAGALHGRGVTRGECVGIALPRSAEALTAMFAIMRAGGAYVVLDTEQPAARLAAMIDDADIRYVIGQEGEVAGSAPAVDVLTPADLDREENAPPSETWPRGEDAAYVLYTSGSTGTPKGVVVEHRNLAHYVDAVSRRLRLPDDATYASVTTLAADLGHTAVYPALCRGGTLHLVPQATATSAAQFAAYNHAHTVDCLKIVPSHLAALMDGPYGAGVLPGKVLVLGGERCSWELVERLHALRPDLRVLNHYGPTETTVGALTHEVDFEAGRAGASVPIGRPLPRMYARVLDTQGRPTPVGLPGELYLGGAGVARGYLKQAARTADAFGRDAKGPDKRMYRTGDRARVLANGDIEFLGRIDDQVKIRGFRVEPGEVAAQLRSHPKISDAAVIIAKDEHGDAHLAAYVAGSRELDREAVWRFLRERVPAYMVPEAVATLDRLPVTANGKLNRTALPAPVFTREKGGDGEARPPQTDTEREVARTWEELLERPAVGALDNFLDLGGHSLLAIRAVSRLNARFGVDLPLAVLFEAPTVAGVAAHVDALRNGNAESANVKHALDETAHRLAVTIRAGGIAPGLFCIAPAGGTTFPYYALAHHMPTDRPVYGLQDPAFDDSQAACGNIEDQAAAYVEAIRAVQGEGPYHLAGWSFGGVVAFEVARQLSARGALVGMVALIEAFAPKARQKFRWRDLGPNLAFLAGFAASGLETVRDSLFLTASPARRNGEGRIRRAWWGGLYRLYLRRAGMAAVVAENQTLLSLDQPSTRRFIRIARANLKAGQRYRGGDYAGSLTVLKASKQPESEAAGGALGWDDVAGSATVALHVIEGDHFNVLRHPNVIPMARIIGETMAQLEQLTPADA